MSCTYICDLTKMKYYRRIRIFTFISSPKVSSYLAVLHTIWRRQRVVSICVKKNKYEKNVHAIFYFSSPCTLYNNNKKHFLAHASKAFLLLMCYIHVKNTDFTEQVLANAVTCVHWNIKSDQENGKIIIPVAQIMMSYITRHVLIHTSLRLDEVVYVYGFLVTGDDGLHLYWKLFTNWMNVTFGDSWLRSDNNASLAFDINMLPSSISSSICLKMNKFTKCDNLNGFLQFLLSLYPGLLLWGFPFVQKKIGHWQ